MKQTTATTATIPHVNASTTVAISTATNTVFTTKTAAANYVYGHHHPTTKTNQRLTSTVQCYNVGWQRQVTTQQQMTRSIYRARVRIFIVYSFFIYLPSFSLY